VNRAVSVNREPAPSIRERRHPPAISNTPGSPVVTHDSGRHACRNSL